MIGRPMDASGFSTLASHGCYLPRDGRPGGKNWLDYTQQQGTQGCRPEKPSTDSFDALNGQGTE
jgi:hypothetical protein